MNVNVFWVFIVILLIPVGYFVFFEKTPDGFFRTAPGEFADEVKDLVFPTTEVVDDGLDDFLESLDERIEEETEELAELTPRAPEETARYRVTFNGTWSGATHAGFYPKNAHFSPLVAWSHSDAIKAVRVGATATPGLEKLAELGGTVTFEQELDELRGNGLHDYDTGKKFDAPGSTSVEIDITESRPFISFVSMIAPSPDWIVTSNRVRVFVDKQWTQEVRVDLAAYDAGTEDGNSFSIDNNASSPQGDISPLTDIPSDTLPLFGHVIITKIK